jgi:hypothetical protein
MEELHTDSIDGGHEASYGPKSRARGGRTPTELTYKKLLWNYTLPCCYKPGRTKAVKERETSLEESRANSRDLNSLDSSDYFRYKDYRGHLD